jgi:hypothetical protein
MKEKGFAATGIAAVVLVMGGTAIAMAGGDTHTITVGSSTADIAKAVGATAPAATWVGAYLELLGLAATLVFALWLCTRLGSGIWTTIGQAAATANAAVGFVSLAIMDTVSYRAGHGLGLATAKTLVTLEEASFVASWFLVALFLLAAGRLALGSGYRKLAWSAFAIVAYTLVLTPVSFDGAGQFSQMFVAVWTLAASILFLRRSPRPVAVPVPA